MLEIPSFIPPLHPKDSSWGKKKERFLRALSFHSIIGFGISWDCVGTEKLQEIQIKLTKAKKEIYWLML